MSGGLTTQFLQSYQWISEIEINAHNLIAVESSGNWNIL